MRRIESFNNRVEKYLDGVEAEQPKDFEVLTTMILKLAEKGKELLNGDTYKQFKSKKSALKSIDIVIIQIKIKRKKYRIHTALTPNYLYLLNTFDKKDNKTRKKEKELTFKRAEKLTKL